MTSSSFLDWSRVRHGRPTAGSWRASALALTYLRAGCHPRFLLLRLKGRLSAGFRFDTRSTPTLQRWGGTSDTGCVLAFVAAVTRRPSWASPWRSRRRLVLTVYW